MNITFQLRDSGYEKSSIRVIVTNGNKVYRKAVGLSCPTKSWRRLKNGSVRSGVDSIDEKLHRLETDLLEVLGDRPGEYEIQNALASIDAGVLTKNKPRARKRAKGIPSFYEFFDEFCDSQTVEEGTRLMRRVSMNLIARLMGNDIDWADINDGFFERFVEAMEVDGRRDTYQATTIANLKSCLRKAYRHGYYFDLSFEEWKRDVTERYKIALGDEEIQRLIEYVPKETKELGDKLDGYKSYCFCGKVVRGRTSSAEVKEKARDLFLLGYKTCARFSDYSRLTMDNIKDDRLVFIQDKTNREVTIPCSPIVESILKKHGGKSPEVHLATFNKVIKQVCYECGIDGEEEIVDSITNTIYKVKRWMVVSSHTARRTAATNLYLKGVPPKELMLLTGHKSMTSLERYLRLDNKKTIEKLAELDFFK